MTRGVVEIASAVAAKEATAESGVRASLDAIGARDGELHAFLQVFGDHAIEQANILDARLAAGEDVGALAGVPIAVKDNICTREGRTTCASRMLERYRSPFDATAVTRLERAGAVIVGKTNLDEFAMGSSCEHSAFGATCNPHDVTRVPGGSSGGSAAAVAAGMVPAALGSDTGGSVRQPASLCGVVGLKPTYGRVSRYGLVAFASSLDQIGVLAGSVADAAAVLEVIAGRDERDLTSATRDDAGFSEEIWRGAAGLTFGVPAIARHESVHPETARVFAETVEKLRAAGARVVDVELPHAEHGVAAYYIVAPAEASSNLARFDGVRYGRRADIGAGSNGGGTLDELYTRSRSEGFGHEVQRRIMLGTHVLSSGYHDAYYLNALRVRRRIKEDFDAVFASGVDAVLTPTCPSPAFKIGEKAGDPLALYLEDVFTVGANLAGVPAISVPAGMARVDGRDLPVGVQLVGRAFGERALLGAASVIEGV
ncbi:MAG: Asp-tRNA(Asn)/Glu-tRNA(Gln) amidotransferase subunit GatA [Phycisphaerales bacterium]